MFNRVVSMCLLFSKEIFAATYYAKNKIYFLKIRQQKASHEKSVSNENDKTTY